MSHHISRHLEVFEKYSAARRISTAFSVVRIVVIPAVRSLRVFLSCFPLIVLKIYTLRFLDVKSLFKLRTISVEAKK